MRVVDEVLVDAGVPDGTLAIAVATARTAAAGLQHVAGPSVRVSIDPVGAAAAVLLPAVLAVRDGTEWARPARPRPAPGGGFVAADLGAPGNEETYLRMLSTLPDDASALSVEAAAQEWRLPVVAYRPWRAGVPARPFQPARVGVAAPHRGDPALPLRGVRVVDLTAMWAGPFATWLLASLGAEVTKIEASVRPDGMRGQPSMFAALDRGKSHSDLDLRSEGGIRAFEDLVREADVVVDSFSPRVMPNFGLDVARLRRLNPEVLVVSLPAFAPGTPEAQWVAYGTGVHAFRGLGDVGAGGFVAPEVTYPDALAGLAVFAEVVTSLSTGARAPLTASISAALEPLVRAPRRDRGALSRPVEPLAETLAADLAARGRLDDVGIATPFVIEPR